MTSPALASELSLSDSIESLIPWVARASSRKPIGPARAAGRDPREIRRLYNVTGALTEEPTGPATDADQAVVGPPEHWVDVLAHFALDLGFSTFVRATQSDPRTLTIFIEKVAPEVRERVAERRAA